MSLNKLIRNLEQDFEMLQEVDTEEIEDDQLRSFVEGLQSVGDEHGFDGEPKEFGIKVYAEFTVYEEAQTAMEAHRRFEEHLSERLTEKVADHGISRAADEIEIIDTKEV
jgi:hypothetical protein